MATPMSTRRRRPTPRSLPTPRSCSSTGSASKAGSSGWSRHPAPRRRSSSPTKGIKPRSGPATTTTMTMAGPTRMPGSPSPMPKSMSPTSATRLIAADPAGKAAYEANATAYIAKLDALEREVKDAIAKVPADRRRIITSHDAFGYFEARLRHRFHRAAGRLDRGRGVGQGRGDDHRADQEAEELRRCFWRTSPIPA